MPDQPPTATTNVELMLDGLRAAHRALDRRIDELVALGATDLLELQRLKKQKLVLKDKIGFLERTRLPDIIA